MSRVWVMNGIVTRSVSTSRQVAFFQAMVVCRPSPSSVVPGHTSYVEDAPSVNHVIWSRWISWKPTTLALIERR